MINARLSSFGATIFSEMTQLAQQHDAINLSQGYPDEDGPKVAIQAAIEAMRAGRNQYARSRGEPDLVRAIAAYLRRTRGLSVDPLAEVTVHSGATEAIASFLLGVLEPGDEVIVFEPFYDSYPAVVSLAGAVPRFCTLRFPEFALDIGEIERLIGRNTRAMVINTPHNPSGKVFTRGELEELARLCRRHDLLVLSDEVYEQMTWDGREHVSIATLDGMFERTVTVSSAGKLFSMTGWKIGWAVGPARLIEAVQAAHQFLTFSSPTPLQAGVAAALESCGDDHFAAQRAELQARRDLLADALTSIGFEIALPQGTYFMLADFRRLFAGDDRAFAEKLVREVGVATIPPSVFYAADPGEGRHLLRFAFCKRRETLEEAARRLARLHRATS